MKKLKEIVLVISDIQLPFHHVDAFIFLKALKEKYDPTKIINVGDLIDHYMLSRFMKEVDAPHADAEYEKVMSFLDYYFKMFPRGIELYSNHAARFFKKYDEAQIPMFMRKKYRDIYKYPKGWDLKEYHIIDNVLYEHGQRCGGRYADERHSEANYMSTVIGHHHAYAGIQLKTHMTGRVTFAMNVGCLMDQDTRGARYAKNHLLKSCLSAGVVDRGVPHLHPMLLDHRGRWIGEII